MKATIYHNPKCSKSRVALEYLEKHNIDTDIRMYMDKGITRAEIYDILELVDCDIGDIIRNDDVTLIDKYCHGITVSKEGIINCLIEHPVLLQRPIILFKARGIGAICRSEDSLLNLFKYVGINFKTETEIVNTK